MQNFVRCFALFFLIIFPLFIQAEGFWNDRYRGWLWFEEPRVVNPSSPLESSPQENITPNQAKAEIEQLKEELEEFKFMMLARPTVENVYKYRKKEQELWQKATTLSESWKLANLVHPEQQDLINNPVNVHAVKMKRELDHTQDTKAITEFAQKFDLVLFFQEGCKYCDALTPILADFSQKYGFKVEAVSMSGSNHSLFKTMTAPKLVAQLGISAAPTVIAVSHNGKVAMELIRGYVTRSELEEYSLLAIKYLKSEDKWPK